MHVRTSDVSLEASSDINSIIKLKAKIIKTPPCAYVSRAAKIIMEVVLERIHVRMYAPPGHENRKMVYITLESMYMAP